MVGVKLSSKVAHEKYLNCEDVRGVRIIPPKRDGVFGVYLELFVLHPRWIFALYALLVGLQFAMLQLIVYCHQVILHLGNLF